MRAALLVLAACMAGAAHAQTFPYIGKPVRIRKLGIRLD